MSQHEPPVPAGSDAAPHGSETSSAHSGVLQRRRLDALQEVSLAAATVLDPRELARVGVETPLRATGLLGYRSGSDRVIANLKQVNP
jgi:hypothetical protein